MRPRPPSYDRCVLSPLLLLTSWWPGWSPCCRCGGCASPGGPPAGWSPPGSGTPCSIFVAVRLPLIRFVIPILVLAFLAPFVAGPERVTRVLAGRRPAPGVVIDVTPRPAPGLAEPPRRVEGELVDDEPGIGTRRPRTTTRRPPNARTGPERAHRPPRRRRVRGRRRGGDGRAARRGPGGRGRPRPGRRDRAHRRRPPAARPRRRARRARVPLGRRAGRDRRPPGDRANPRP